MEDNLINYTYINEGISGLLVAASSKGICKIDFGKDEELFLEWMKKNKGGCIIKEDNFLLNKCMIQLKEYFNKERKSFTIETDLSGTEFQKKVFNQISKIPYGNTATYKELGQKYGKGYSRAVGNAANKNPLPIIIPCHRVIGSDGTLIGFAGGLEVKRYLLELERE